MTEEDRKKLRQLLAETDANLRIRELQKKFPTGLMTKAEICKYVGRPNQNRWGDAFVKGLTPYTDGIGRYKQYRIADVVAKLITYDRYEDVYGEEE